RGGIAPTHRIPAQADLALAAVRVAPAAVATGTVRTITVRFAGAVLVRNTSRPGPPVGDGALTRSSREKRRTLHDGASPQPAARASIVAGIDATHDDRRLVQARVLRAYGGGVPSVRRAAPRI